MFISNLLLCMFVITFSFFFLSSLVTCLFSLVMIFFIYCVSLV